MRPWYADNAWLTVKDADPHHLMAFLDLVDPVEMTWAEVAPHKQRLRERLGRQERRDLLNRLVFISPPLQGWRLLVGNRFWMADPEEAASCQMDPYSEVAAGCVRASQRFGEAHLFTSSWDNGDYAWVLARDGNISRQFVLVGGEIVVDAGEPVAAERQLLAAYKPGPVEEDPWACFEHPESVAAIAASCSVHPAEVEACTGKGYLTRWQRE
jgi:hypothetical protein